MPYGVPGSYVNVRTDESTASAFALRRFGGPTTVRTSTVSVTTSVTRIVGNNPRRVQLTLYNRGVFNIDVDYASTVASGAGIPLTASSGIAASTIEDDGEVIISEVYGIGTTGTSAVFVVEVLRV